MAIAFFMFFQMIIPFLFGLIIGIVTSELLSNMLKCIHLQKKDSILNYRRVDPINEKERLQNDEALRILEKKYVEEKISKEEYLKRKKEFEEIEKMIEE